MLYVTLSGMETIMKKIFAMAAGVALGLGISSAMAASETAVVGASLEVQGECEVIATAISATTENFTGSDVTLNQGASALNIVGFDNHPADMTLTAGSTVAILCSASGADHTLTLASSGATLSDGATGTLAWAPVYAKVSEPETTVAIATGPGTDVGLVAVATEATLHEYIITATVLADDIAEVNPGNYTGSVDLTVSYGDGI
jgi:hypothetical protein